jgi:PhnB protein
MRFIPHLIFDGRCEAAFQFYQRSLGGNLVTMLTYGSSPMAGQVPAEWRDKIVHANLTIGDTELIGADAFPDLYQRPQGFFVLLEVSSPERAEQTFSALSEKGTVLMPIHKTFWSLAFGALVDQFGIPWEITCPQTPLGQEP